MGTHLGYVLGMTVPENRRHTEQVKLRMKPAAAKKLRVLAAKRDIPVGDLVAELLLLANHTCPGPHEYMVEHSEADWPGQCTPFCPRCAKGER